MFSRYCSVYHDRRGHAALRKHLRKCFLVLVNYLEELFYLFTKYQWLYLRVCHIRKFRFFLPFLTRRETISIQRWGSEPSPNADNPKNILCLRVQLRCCGSCSQRLICLHAWALFRFHAFVNIYSFGFCPLLSEQICTVMDTSLLARRSFWLFSAWRDRYVQALYGTN